MRKGHFLSRPRERVLSFIQMVSNRKAPKSSVGTFVSLPLAKANHRVVAGMFDLAVLMLGSVIIMLPSLLVFIESVNHPSPSRSLAVFLVMFLTGALVAVFDLAYRVMLPYFFDGQTLGYRFFRLRLLSEDGGKISLQQLLARSVVIFFVAVFTVGLYYVVEALTLLLSSTHRSFADTISQTLIVDCPEDN